MLAAWAWAGLLAGCAELGRDPYSPWRDIKAAASFLEAPGLAGPGGTTRRARYNVRERQEWWTWNGGQLRAVELNPGRYFRAAFDDRELLEAGWREWDYLIEIGFVPDAGAIARLRDSRAWALRVMTGRSIDGDVVCAYGVRLIGDVPGAPPLGAHPSRGYVHGYHCALAQKQAADTVAAHLLALFDGLGPRRD